MTPGADERELVALDRDECLRLLDLETIGRVACSSGPDEGPEVVPVNFTHHEGVVCFRTGDGELLERVVDRPVSLQVDRYDWFHQTGWSVLVRGTAKLVTEVDEFELHERHVETWAPGKRPHIVRITPRSITGRRIELHQRPLDAEGYL